MTYGTTTIYIRSYQGYTHMPRISKSRWQHTWQTQTQLSTSTSPKKKDTRHGISPFAVAVNPKCCGGGVLAGGGRFGPCIFIKTKKYK